MLDFDLSHFQEAFDRNWEDWCLGDEGGTRSGSKVHCDPIRLVGYRKTEVSVKDALSKNPDQTKRWHIAFLEGRDNTYVHEYLKSRYYSVKCQQRIFEVFGLLNNIKVNGVKVPIWVAELDDMLFRFDGCHRTCCAHVCGIEMIPALVFKTERLT